MMRVVAALCLVLLAAAGAMSAPSPFKAVYAYAMGVMVSGECRKIGYHVNSDAWHALAASEYDDVEADAYDPALFNKGGRYGTLSATIYLTLIQMVELAGPGPFCSSVLIWAKREHPRIGQELISWP